MFVCGKARQVITEKKTHVYNRIIIANRGPRVNYCTWRLYETFILSNVETPTVPHLEVRILFSNVQLYQQTDVTG